MDKERNQQLYEEWDRRWEGSDKSEKLTALGKFMFKAKIQVLKKILKDIDIKTIIEVGCGLGHIMELYTKLNYNNTIGIDISENSIKVCKNKGLNVKQQDVKNVKEKYDLVSSDGMLEHFLNFEEFVKEFTRISNKYVLVIQPNHGSFCGKTLVYIAELLRGDKNVFEYNYRINDFITVFNEYNFKCIKNIPVFYDIFRILVFEKVGK